MTSDALFASEIIPAILPDLKGLVDLAPTLAMVKGSIPPMAEVGCAICRCWKGVWWGSGGGFKAEAFDPGFYYCES